MMLASSDRSTCTAHALALCMCAALGQGMPPVDVYLCTLVQRYLCSTAALQTQRIEYFDAIK